MGLFGLARVEGEGGGVGGRFRQVVGRVKVGGEEVPFLWNLQKWILHLGRLAWAIGDFWREENGFLENVAGKVFVDRGELGADLGTDELGTSQPSHY